MKPFLIMLFCLLSTLSLSAQTQTYNAPVTLSKVDYPATMPCPYSGSGCTAGTGSLTGAGFCQAPSDFPNTTICRITDVHTVSNQHTYNTSCDASSEVNDWNTKNDRFTICAAGQHQLLYSFDTSTNTAMQDTTFVSPGSSSMFFSYTQPYIMYHAHLNGSNDLSIFSYDTSALGNPTGVQVVDLSTCVAALAGNVNGQVWEGVNVSADDQTFAVGASTNGGQGSTGAIYVIVWNRTNGCNVWNTGTSAVTGFGTTGNVNIADQFNLHNVRLGKGGTWVKVAINACTNGSCTSPSVNYNWQVGTINVTKTFNDFTWGCGHSAMGFSTYVNKCTGSDNNGLYSRPAATPNSFTSLPTAYPSPDAANGAHITWANNNSSDTNPFIAIFQAVAFGVVDGWDNEILGVSTNGSGKIYRLAHTYATAALAFTPGSISQDGHYILWTTDWDGMLGKTDNVTTACTVGTANCRTDVFLGVLPLNIAPPPTARTSKGTVLSHGATIQ